MKLGYLNSVLKTSLLTTLFGIGAFSANAAGHLPSTYQVEGKNHGRVIDSIITEIAPGLMRIENENAVVFTFSETREDFPQSIVWYLSICCLYENVGSDTLLDYRILLCC